MGILTGHYMHLYILIILLIGIINVQIHYIYVNMSVLSPSADGEISSDLFMGFFINQTDVDCKIDN